MSIPPPISATIQPHGAPLWGIWTPKGVAFVHIATGAAITLAGVGAMWLVRKVVNKEVRPIPTIDQRLIFLDGHDIEIEELKTVFATESVRKTLLGLESEEISLDAPPDGVSIEAARAHNESVRIEEFFKEFEAFLHNPAANDPPEKLVETGTPSYIRKAKILNDALEAKVREAAWLETASSASSRSGSRASTPGPADRSMPEIEGNREFKPIDLAEALAAVEGDEETAERPGESDDNGGGVGDAAGDLEAAADAEPGEAEAAPETSGDTAAGGAVAEDEVEVKADGDTVAVDVAEVEPAEVDNGGEGVGAEPKVDSE